MAAYLRNENPTGRYNLNLSREVDRVVASRLLLQAQKEEYWRSNKTMLNFRNVILKGNKIDISDPANFSFPNEGLLRFDYIVYSKGEAAARHEGRGRWRWRREEGRGRAC